MVENLSHIVTDKIGLCEIHISYKQLYI